MSLRLSHPAAYVRWACACLRAWTDRSASVPPCFPLAAGVSLLPRRCRGEEESQGLTPPSSSPSAYTPHAHGHRPSTASACARLACLLPVRVLSTESSWRPRRTPRNTYPSKHSDIIDLFFYMCLLGLVALSALWHRVAAKLCLIRQRGPHVCVARASALHGVQPRRAFNHPVPLSNPSPSLRPPPFPPTGTLLFACCLFSRPTP